MNTTRRRRVLSKAEQQTAIGAELLALCQASAADGVLADEEIAALREWLATNRTADLPAIGFLTTTVESVLADGKITAPERMEIHRAVEAVLPVELRADAAAARRSALAADRERTREDRARAKDLEAEQRSRKAPLGKWDFMVAGTQFEGRAGTIERFLEPDTSVWLVPDPTNRYDRNAVGVRTDRGHDIGYVPREDAAEISQLLLAGAKQRAYCKKILGYSRPIPVIVAELFRSDADKGSSMPVRVDGAATPPARVVLPSGKTYEPSAVRGALWWAGILAALVGVAALLRCGQ